MKQLTLTLVFLLIFLGTNVLAQNAIYSTNIQPKQIESSEALKQTKAAFSVCGFVSAYFQKSDLMELMDVKNCVGIRFYTSMEDPQQRYADIIGVAVDRYGKEIGNFLERKYHLAKSLDAHYPHEYTKMNKSRAKKCVKNLNESVAKIESYSAFMGIDNLNQLLDNNGCTGVRIYAGTMDGTTSSNRTMHFGAAKVEGKLVKDAASKYVISNLPCPVDCGDDPYLWEK